MGIETLGKWAELLLDTGKRNNLINFRDSKGSTVELIAPDCKTVFDRCQRSATLEVFDIGVEDEEDELDLIINNQAVRASKDELSKEELFYAYASKLKNNQVLPYNVSSKPISALKNIKKASKTAIEETGVNIAYIAFGFIHWSEATHPADKLKAPVLLLPVSIENESHAEPYRIRVVDNEFVVNPTFSYKLKHEYGISLPEWEEEDGIEAYFQKLREQLSRLGWTVTDECKVGIFSFLKINMYTDLKENAHKIIANETVKALMGEREFVYGEGASCDCEILNVVDADSSQEDAIKMAMSGKSFVLQGPPGTGKSQTITNMIAQCLYDGKKVLFVSEKLAALNVVYNKLKSVGLADFCLELHSHKANKKLVIEELCRTLKLRKSELSSRAEGEIEAKKRAKTRLDGYADELHAKREKINKSLYEMIEDVSELRLFPDVEYVVDSVDTKGEEYIDNALTLLKRYVEYTSCVGTDYHSNAWCGFTGSYTYASAIELKGFIEKTSELAQSLTLTNQEAKDKLQIGVSSINETKLLCKLLGVLKDSAYLTGQHLNREKIGGYLLSIDEISPVANEVNRLKGEIDSEYDSDIYELNGNSIYKKLTREYTGFFKRFFSSEYRKIIKSLRLCKKDGAKLKYNEAVDISSTLSKCQESLRKFTELESDLREALNGNYRGEKTDFARMRSEVNNLSALEFEKLHLESFKSLASEDLSTLKPIFSELYLKYSESFGRSAQDENKLAMMFDAEQFPLLDASIDKVIEKCRLCYDNMDKLETWTEFYRILTGLKEMGLKNYVDYAIETKMSTLRLVGAFKKSFYRQWIDFVIHSTPALLDMNRVTHDETVGLFCQKDEISFEVNRAIIKSKLSMERPSLDMVAHGSAVSILLREGEKKRKQKGIRQLLADTGELAQTIKPLFLMSPLSVSTYLSADMSFDVVIFDEASQIFPQDAIGAIYRGKQLIVVGDSKQMPPSNFFTSIADDTDEDDSLSDFESILDICSATFPQCCLKWHYRSRYEQLISFSNKNFYGNSLVTFPSAQKDRRGIGVDYYYVDGVFDRRTRTNLSEALKVVDLVFANLEKYPERSLGVVAFSLSQQNLIDKLIARRRREDPSKEELFKSTREEPFFVKNLETVQGDERDTVIFSVAYGKDASGKVLMNFGPVNRAGGERRLNVAVTRAKCNVQLVSSMHYSDIDLSRATSEGARLLREYLDFAENGIIALSGDGTHAEDSYESAFENEIYDFLGQNGYAVDKQVGCSEFKVDLAVKRKDRDDYVLAIECDGQSYLCEKTTRDRDRLRKMILERMGWKFYRIWSTDWFRSKNGEKEKLLYEVQRAMESAVAFVDTDIDEKTESFSTTVTEESFTFPQYEMIRIEDVEEECSYDIIQIIRTVLEKEAPLSDEWLLRRIVYMFDGHGRVTQTVKDSFDYTLRNCESVGIVRRDGFMYLSGKEIPMLRVPKDDAPVIREIKHICKEELACGLLEVIKRNVTLEKSGLFRMIVQKLGFGRITDAITDRLEESLLLLTDKIIIDGDEISLKP